MCKTCAASPQACPPFPPKVAGLKLVDLVRNSYFLRYWSVGDADFAGHTPEAPDLDGRGGRSLSATRMIASTLQRFLHPLRSSIPTADGSSDGTHHGFTYLAKRNG